LVIAAAGIWIGAQAFLDSDGQGDESGGRASGAVKNGMIAFVSDRGGDLEVYVMNPDGTGIAQITDNEIDDDTPSWSPYGTALVTASERAGGDDRLHLYLVEPSVGERTRLGNEAQHITSPSWSPDSSRIAFSACCDFGTQVYVINADGTGEVRLTDEASDGVSGAYDPAWSPDGTNLALTIIRYDPQTQEEREAIYVMNDDGNGLIRLTDPSDINFGPAWSPDGTKIVFTSRRDGNSEIYVMNADGSGQANLTGSVAEEAYPTFSPDGTRILFAGTGDGDWDLYVMDVDGSNARRLTSTSENEWEPDWARVPAQPSNGAE